MISLILYIRYNINLLITLLEINVNYNLEEDGEIIIIKNINRKTTYNNITDKFELENYENSIIDNISQNISDKIIFSVSEINK